MTYLGLMIYLGVSVLLWVLNIWIGVFWSVITGVGFYVAVILDERDRRRRGEIK